MHLGLSQVELTGNSIYEYIHPLDHEELVRGEQVEVIIVMIWLHAVCQCMSDIVTNHSS